MAYGEQPLSERLAGAAGTATMVGLMGAVLLLGLAGRTVRYPERDVPLLDIRLAPPPKLRERVEPAARKAAKDAPSPRNLRNKATDLVVPPPILQPPTPPPPIIAAPKANIGLAAQSGASNLAGPGEGAGGVGNGSGGGGEGNGLGYVPPRQIKGRLKNSDLPETIVHDQDADGMIGVVGVSYHVERDGRVGSCQVTSSSGKPMLDAITCRLIQERFRFKPSLDPAGNPVGAEIVETHGWGVIHDDAPDPRR